jgi:hypothetical protein
MPLDNADAAKIPKREPTDLLYGLDTGKIKYRTFYRKHFYPADTDEQHKIDFYTKGLGCTPGSALPATWKADKKGDVTAHKEYRNFLVGGTTQTPFVNRYNPENAKDGDEWNARFRRTSKAGLQWGLLVKKWNVHFIVNDLDFRDAATKPTKDKDGKPLPKGTSAGNKDSRRITYCELRWLYRHREFDIVKKNVQFWRYEEKPDPHFVAIKAPWVDDPKLWSQYNPKNRHILQDYALAGSKPQAKAPGTQFSVPEGTSQAVHLAAAAIRQRQLDKKDPLNDDDDDDWI